jgi:hypothetical protein
VRDFGVESSMRLDVFQAKVAAEKNIKDSGEWENLSAEEKRLVDKMVGVRQQVIFLTEIDVVFSSYWTGNVLA